MGRLVRGRSTYVRIIQHWSQYPEEHDESNEYLQLSPPGYHKQTTCPRDLHPIKRDEGHAQPRVHAEELVDNDIVRGHPAYKGKDGECFEKMACRVKPVNCHMREQGKIKKNTPGKKKRRKLPMNTIMKCLLPRMPFPP